MATIWLAGNNPLANQSQLKKALLNNMEFDTDWSQ